MNVACLSVDMYLSVCMDISETRNHMSYSEGSQILFVCYLWLWLSYPFFGRIGYVLPNVYDSCHVSVAHAGQEWASQ